MELNDLKDSLKTLKYGEIAVVAMIDRGAYAEAEDVIVEDVTDGVTGGSKMDTSIFKTLAADVKSEEEDLTVVRRSDIDIAMTQDDFDWFINQMSAKKHIVFLECLYLGTTEIKGFLNSLKSKKLLDNSKLVLLDLPQLEYMMLKDSLAGQFNL